MTPGIMVTGPEKRVFDALHEVVIITDLDGRIVLWNRSAEELYGWSAAEVMGRNIVDVVPTEQSRDQAAQIMASLARGVRWDGEFIARRRDGTPFVAWVSDVPYFDEEGVLVGVIGLSRDVSVTRTEGRNLALLVGLAPILGASLDYEVAAKQACRALVPAFSDIATITVLDDAELPSRLAVVAIDPHSEKLLRESPLSPGDIDIVRRAMSERRAQLILGPAPLYAPDRAPRGEPKVVEDIEITSSLFAPLVARGEAIGVVTFRMVARTGRSFGPTDAIFAEELGHRVGLAIENAHLHTRLRASEAASTLAWDRARIAEKRKDEFLAMLGHELRNPLAPIVTAFERMKSRGQPSREELIIGRQISHMVRLVDDLLDVARVARREFDLQREIVELSQIVTAAVELAGPLIEQRSHHLHLDVPLLGLTVDGDRTRLAQVLSNLLTNAAKYTDPGGNIRVRAWRDNEDVWVSVVDDGWGIAAEALPDVFEPFVQSSQGPDRAQGGLGVGLTLARYLVELHGGVLLATSKGIGQGAELLVCLPLVAASARPPAVRVEAIAPASEKKHLRVLLVDDNADILEILAGALRDLGHEVSTAEDGAAALLLAASTPLDVAVVDIGLPVMDGYELAERLRIEVPQLTLVALTGYGQPEDRARSKKAGFATHLVKPIDLATLLGALLPKVDAMNTDS